MYHLLQQENSSQGYCASGPFLLTNVNDTLHRVMGSIFRMSDSNLDFSDCDNCSMYSTDDYIQPNIMQSTL